MCLLDVSAVLCGRRERDGQDHDNDAEREREGKRAKGEGKWKREREEERLTARTSAAAVNSASDGQTTRVSDAASIRMLPHSLSLMRLPFILPCFAVVSFDLPPSP